jgi:sugar phosphate isomerase/epimerase
LLYSNAPKHWPLGTSTALFSEITQADLDACVAAGISHIELGLRTAWLDTEEGHAVMTQRTRMIMNAGLHLWSIHLPFGARWDPSSPNENVRENMVQVFSEVLAYAGSVGIGQAVIHPSWEPVAVEERPEALQRSKTVLHRLADIASSHGVHLAAECLPRTCLGNCIREIEELLLGSETLRVCIDTGHLLNAKAEDFIRQIGSKIVTVHIQDYDRIDDRHWLPGNGVNNWTAIIGELARTGYEGPFMFELLQKTAGPLTPQDLRDCWEKLLIAYLSNESLNTEETGPVS